MGELHLRLGESDEARRHYESILWHWGGSDDPTVQQVRRRLNTLNE